MEGKMQICRKKNLKKQPIINKIRRAKLRIPQFAYVTINEANWLFVLPFTKEIAPWKMFTH